MKLIRKRYDAPDGESRDGNDEAAITPTGGELGLEAGEGPRARSASPGRNPNLKAHLIFILAVLGACGGLTLGQVWPIAAATQYGYALSALLMLILETVYNTAPRGFRATWLIAWAAIVVTSGVLHPGLPLIGIDSTVFWVFTLAEWKCELATMPRPGAVTARVLRGITAFKRMFGSRRGRCVGLATALAAGTAMWGTAGAVVESYPLLKTGSHAGVISSGTPDGGKSQVAPPNYDMPPASPRTDSQRNSAPSPARWDGQCRIRQYPEVEDWASAQIIALLAGEAKLGREEEGCVEFLTEHHGFVSGVGVEPLSGRPLSIVVDSYDLKPAIFLTPALGAVEALIKKYKDIGGTEKEFSRYQAGRGDYYVVNTASEGSCVIMRSKSGTTAEEGSPYNTLPPAVAVAWVRITKLRRTWQWVAERATSNSRGERVFALTAPGASVPDAEVTLDQGGEAHWVGTKFFYPREQRDLSPTELEQLSHRYLLE